MPANRRNSGKANKTSFKPGQSGNPSGRPKRTEEQKDALEKIRALAPDAAEVIKSIMMNDGASESARIKCAEIIFDRAFGRSETGIKADIALSEGDFVLRIVGEDAGDRA